MKPRTQNYSISILAFLLLGICTSALAQEAKKLNFFIGTYTNGQSKGIYRSALNLSDGSLEDPILVAELRNPSFLAMHPKKDVLYAVSEVSEGDRQLVAYSIQDDLTLSELGSMNTAGSGPCYVSITADGMTALVANYGSGSICSYRLGNDGSLERQASTIQHVGSSVHPRQKSPHAHCIQETPDGKHVCAVDLGLDQVVIYDLDPKTSQLSDNSTPLRVSPGNGPRHVAFHPNGDYAFVIHELTCQLSVCKWNAGAGALSETQEITTLPGDFKQGFSTAEVLVHPNGRFVYGSNRGHDSIAAFEFEDGKLTSLGHVSTEGKTPRNFRIDPTGAFLLAENQGSDSIVVFRIEDSGKLSSTGKQMQVGSPVCIKFAR